MVTPSRTCLTAVLRKALPKRRAGATLESVCANTDDAVAIARLTTKLARFHKEVNAALRPIEASVTIREHTRTANSFGKNSQQVVETFQMSKSYVIHDAIIAEAFLGQPCSQWHLLTENSARGMEAAWPKPSSGVRFTTARSPCADGSGDEPNTIQRTTGR